MLTANALAEHIEQSRAAGADHHLIKPMTSEALFGALALLATPDIETDSDALASRAL
jgi:CheY-like chemotaxis protein